MRLQRSLRSWSIECRIYAGVQTILVFLATDNRTGGGCKNQHHHHVFAACRRPARMSRRYLRQCMSRGYGTELPIQNVRSSVVAESSADRELKNPTTGIADCCARAAIGHPATPLPRSAMNSRRLMGLSPPVKPRAG